MCGLCLGFLDRAFKIVALNKGITDFQLLLDPSFYYLPTYPPIYPPLFKRILIFILETDPVTR